MTKIFYLSLCTTILFMASNFAIAEPDTGKITESAAILAPFAGGITLAKVKQSSIWRCVENPIKDFHADVACFAKQTHSFGPDETAQLFFAGEKCIAMTVLGKKADVIAYTASSVKNARRQMILDKNGPVSRWSSANGAFYLIDVEGEKVAQALIVVDEGDAMTTDLRYELPPQRAAITRNGLGDINSEAQRVDGPTSSPPSIVTVFGIELGKKFLYPECPSERSSSINYKAFPKRACFQRFDANRKDQILNEYVIFKTPSGESPKFVLNLAIGVVNGNAEAIKATTPGLAIQNYFLTDLKTKFGEPTTLTPRKSQNLAGAQFNTFDAAWTRDQYTVTYSSVEDNIENGRLEVVTSIGTKAEQTARKQRELNSTARPL